MSANDQKQEMGNDHLKLVLTKSLGCQIQLDVEIFPEATEASYKKAIKKVKKEVSLPGFRKGKAPDQVILDHFKSHVEKEWSNIIVFTAFKESLDLIKIHPLSQEAVKKPKFTSGPSLEEGAKIIFNFESYPEIPDVEFDKLKIKEVAKDEVPNELIEQTIENIRLGNAKWEDVKDRGVEEEDFVVLNVDNIDQDPPVSAYKNQRFSVTKDKMNTWMSNALLGLTPGNSAEGISEPTQDASKEEKENFKPIKYKFELIKIEKPILPELNDELAKKVNAESVEDLKEKVKENLEKETEKNHRFKHHASIIEKLLELYDFDLPVSICKAEKNSQIKEKIRELKQQGESDESIKDKQKIIEEQSEKDVNKSLRWTFLMQKIAANNDIVVSHQDLVDAIIKNFGGMGNQEQLINSILNNKDLKSKCLTQAKEEKVKNLLLQKATFIKENNEKKSS